MADLTVGHPKQAKKITSPLITSNKIQTLSQHGTEVCQVMLMLSREAEMLPDTTMSREQPKHQIKSHRER